MYVGAGPGPAPDIVGRADYVDSYHLRSVKKRLSTLLS